MSTFLHDVAEYIMSCHSDDLRNSCAVFPNQRSAVYFYDEIKKFNNKVTWLPKNMTIDDFMHSIGNQKVASQITLHTTLYQVHQELAAEKEAFDKFFPWAQVLLSDFDDIDKYLANADALLRNVQDIKELDSAVDYLSENQKEAVKRFFHATFDGEDTKLKKRFLSIWHILLPLYNEFGKRLNANGFSYEGQVYRCAAEKISSADYELPFSKVYFIGFNAITRSEEQVFEVLKAQGKALFFWDYDNMYLNNPLHEAGFFLRRHVEKFKAPDDFVTSHDFDWNNKKINIIASPTVSGQMSVAVGQIGEVQPGELSDTALVLSDETQLMNAVEHISPYISDMNVTMGYKIRNSVAGQWIELLLQLQANKRTSTDNVTFYFKNVLAVLQHPFFVSVSADFSKSMADRIRKEPIFQVAQDILTEDEFGKLVFCNQTDSQTFSGYLLAILKYLMASWNTSEGDSFVLQKELVYRLILQIQQLDTELSAEKLTMDLNTYFQLLRKYVNSLKVPFSGEPIRGLQMMGFLETRNLDFKNLIVLNVNEGTIPVDGSGPSFVPYSLRRAFGLPTHEEREAMYAYYFYRLLQRAENVTLTYFVGKVDGRAGEPSRYIMQLLYGDYNATEKQIQSDIRVASSVPIEMKKNKLTMDLLETYVNSGEKDAPMLSPSALVTYQKCPLQFYFNNVMRLAPDDDIDENIDDRQFGIIFHDAMHEIYKAVMGKEMGADEIGKLSKELMDSRIDYAFANHIFPKKKDMHQLALEGKINIKENLNGANKLVYSVIRHYVESQLEYDKSVAKENPITFVGLEEKYSMLFPIEINGRKIKVNLGGIIDRIDKIGDEIRIIDYKTGGNKVLCDTIDDVFDAANISDYKGILQTLVYCLIFSHKRADEHITPHLFMTRELDHNPDFKIRSKNDEFSEGSYRRVEDKVKAFVTSVLTDIFDADKPFVQTDNEDNCKHCNFFYLCNKQAGFDEY